MAVDKITSKWVRNRSDELAAAAGCRFDEARGQHVVDWIHRFCKLYEGEFAGQPLELRDWQLDCTMRMFGWVHHSQQWKREVRRFREASIWVAKKNKKSPTLASWSLYLFCGDGEPGQKVFLAAVDGNQARKIAGEHVVQMLRRSPDLESECTLNRTTMRVSHGPTTSFLEPLSSANARTQKSKEGLNGCVMIDECHVVDGAFVARLSRAGISRSEPMMIEVSTAGNDPDSYGKARFDYAASVERGDAVDQSLFVAIYAAPQDLKPDDLDADPMKYGRMANPAMGHTVDPDEYLADYQKSKASPAKLADFMMYRLNVWQSAANPWLNMTDWAACRRKYTEKDLLGRECFGAFDLAKTMDTTALVLIFPETDDSWLLWPYIWLPEERAKSLNHLVRYLDWEQQKHVALTPGRTTDYNYVRKVLNEVRKKFRLRKLAFDGTYAAQLVQRLEEEDGWPSGEDGVCVEFRQRITDFAAPTAAFERGVIDGKILHPGNPCMTWQAGNVRVKTDANENMRPVKQQHGDYHTIDSIVSAIMALGLATDKAEEEQYRAGALLN